MILAPWLPRAAASSWRAVTVWGAIDWIKLRPLTWPYTTLRESAGEDKLFWVFLALAGFGVWQQWRTAPRVAGFFTAWIIGPFLAVMAVTYLIHPLEFPRYVLIAFVGMFALAGLGAASIPSTGLRILLVLFLMHIGVRLVHERVRHSDEAAWREATLIAAHRTRQGNRVVVYPPYCDNVVRFYMPRERRDDVGDAKKCEPSAILVISGIDSMPPTEVAKLTACYPRTVAELPLIQVRSVN
jgi:hypothetical protein